MFSETRRLATGRIVATTVALASAAVLLGWTLEEVDPSAGTIVVGYEAEMRAHEEQLLPPGIRSKRSES